MKTIYDIRDIVSNIDYKDWQFRIMEKGDGFLLQVIFQAKDVKTGKLEDQHCRKWYVSAYSCNAEIVRTAFKAVEAAELHELHENFKYKDCRVFDPHLDLDSIVEAVENGSLYENLRD